MCASVPTGGSGPPAAPPEGGAPAEEARTLGQLVRARRRELGLTQEQFAARIGGGLRQSDVSRLERGKVTLPRRERLELIAAALGLLPGELLVRSGWAGATSATAAPAERAAALGRRGVPARPAGGGRDRRAERSDAMVARAHVLVVNDDPDILDLYRELLEEAGYLVSLAQAPPPGSGDVAALAPDLVLLDLLVGNEDLRPWLFAELKASPATARIPVLVCTGARLTDEERADLAGWVCSVLPKPFDLDELLGAVARCLEPPTA